MLRAEWRWTWLVVLVLLAQQAVAADCASIWPAAITANSSVAPTLPTFSGIGALTLDSTLGAGDFQYGTTSLASGALTTTTTTTRLYFNGGLSLSGSVNLNGSGNPQNLIIIVNGSVSIAGQAVVHGLIYATGAVALAEQATITGAVTAAGSITTSGTASVGYSGSAVASAGYSSLCTPPAAPVVKMASPVCGTSNTLLVSFDSGSGRVGLGASAETLTNYQVVAGDGTVLTVAAATLSNEGFDVQLKLASQLQNGQSYTVSVANVRDKLGTVMTAGSDSFDYSSTSNGLVGKYWANTSLSGSTSLKRVDSNVDFSWGGCFFFICAGWPVGGFSTGFSTRWEGYIEPDASGTYYFQIESSEGARMWLDDVTGGTVIDRWSSSLGTATSSGIALVAGHRYAIKLEYYKTGSWFTDSAEMHLRWSLSAGGTFTAVPNANLYTCVNSFVSDTGLVAYYSLEGPTWNGTTGEVVDSSGNHLDGTTVGNPTTAPAQVCNGAVMDGTNYISINDNPLMDLTNALSITAWIKMNALGTDLKSIFSKDTNYEFHINRYGEVYWWWNTNLGYVRSFTTSPYTISLNAWHHIGVVYSGTRQSIYIDGVERAYRTYSGEILATNNLPMQIGADQGIASRIWNGMIDEVRVYDRALTSAQVITDMNTTHPCASSLDHFEISVAATASVCAATPVTIRAVQIDGSTYTGYTGTINISTSANHGNWSIQTGAGVLNPSSDTNDDGAVQYSFAVGDNGQAILNLADTHADQLSISATENGGTATGTSGTVTFSENAFDIVPTDSLGTDVVAGRDHLLQVTALRRDPGTGTCGTFTAYDGNINLKGWIIRSALDAGGAAPRVTTTGADVALPASQPATDNLNLAFSQGVATLRWKTSDVGQYQFHLLDDTSGLVKDINGNALGISGTGSGNYTVRPFGLYVLAQSQRTPATNNPGASSAAGDAFVRAGEDFSVTVSAVAYPALPADQAAQDANADGMPDAGADLSGDAPTPGFGNEGASAANHESVVLTAALQSPAVAAGATDPGLTGATSVAGFSGGVATTTVSYSEVGIIRIDAGLTDGDYLGSGHNVSGAIPYVGRFYPDHFVVSPDFTPQLRNGDGSWSCNFTYQGQPFGFVAEPALSITAKNTHGDTTNNYAGAFWSLTLPQHHLELDPASLPAGSSCASGGSVVAGCFVDNSAGITAYLNGTTVYDGTGTYTSDAHVLTITKLNKQPNTGDVPYDPSLDYVLPQDQLTITETNGDSICYPSAAACTDYRLSGITGVNLRYGRGWIDNTNGPVMTPLIMTLRLQYWNAANAFVTNTDDNSSGGCTGTLVLPADIQLSDFTGNLGASETAVTGMEQHPGYYLLSLSAPGYDSSNQPNAGTALVTWLLDADTSDNNPGEACTQPWLCYDFDGDGGNDNPAARAIFSTLPDARPMLFLKESYR